MIRIDIFDLYQQLSSTQDFEKKSYAQIRRDLDALHEQTLVYEMLHKGSFFEDTSQHVSNHDMIQFRALLSKIGDTKEIIGKLHELSNSIELLRSALARNHDKETKKLFKHITKDKHCGISTLVSDLTSMQNKIELLEAQHQSILDNNFSLDIKTRLEAEFKKKHWQLTKLYVEQKNIFLNLSYLFLEMMRTHAKKE